jgi:hypothetical protein
VRSATPVSCRSRQAGTGREYSLAVGGRAAVASRPGADRTEVTATKQPFAVCEELSSLCDWDQPQDRECKTTLRSRVIRRSSPCSTRRRRALAVLLQDELIPAEIIAKGIPMRWEIQVPSEFLEQALRLYEQWMLSDAELSYLATGALGD